jgi:hypothetical protein
MNNLDSQIENQINTIIDKSMENLNNNKTNETTEVSESNESPESTEVSESNESTESTIVASNIEGFNTALHQYLEIQEEIKVLLNAIKLRNQKKKQLGLSLSSYLRENKIKNVNLGGTYKGKKLESVVTHKVTGFNKEAVTDAIYNELKEDEEVFAKIMESISKKSVMSEIWKIKITSDKVSKEKKEKNNISMAEELLGEE